MKSETTRVQTTGVLVDIKEKAEAEAIRQGFGNLNDVVRLLITQFAEGNIRVGVRAARPDEYLSPETLAEYARDEKQLLKDIAEGKAKSYGLHNIDEMMEDLTA